MMRFKIDASKNTNNTTTADANNMNGGNKTSTAYNNDSININNTNTNYTNNTNSSDNTNDANNICNTNNSNTKQVSVSLGICACLHQNDAKAVTLFAHHSFLSQVHKLRSTSVSLLQPPSHLQLYKNLFSFPSWKEGRKGCLWNLAGLAC